LYAKVFIGVHLGYGKERSSADALGRIALLVTFYHLAYASGYIRPETLRHRSVLVA